MDDPTQLKPAGTRPTAARPEEARPDGARPEMDQPEEGRPKRIQSQGTQPQGTGPERTRPNRAQPAVIQPAEPKPTDPQPTPRKSTSRRAETRQRILTVAGHLFRKHGVDGIGLDAVMKEAGLTHGGFYLHFPSKDALAAAVSQSLLEKAAHRWDEISRSPDRNAALERIVLAYLNPARIAAANCCPLTTLGSDIARQPTARDAISGALDGMLDALTRVQPNRKRQKALTSLSTMVGAIVLSRLSNDPALADAFLEAAAASILPAKRASNPTELLAETEDA